MLHGGIEKQSVLCVVLGILGNILWVSWYWQKKRGHTPIDRHVWTHVGQILPQETQHLIHMKKKFNVESYRKLASVFLDGYKHVHTDFKTPRRMFQEVGTKEYPFGSA